jgi:hypothetical protein
MYEGSTFLSVGIKRDIIIDDDMILSADVSATVRIFLEVAMS